MGTLPKGLLHYGLANRAKAVSKATRLPPLAKMQQHPFQPKIRPLARMKQPFHLAERSRRCGGECLRGCRLGRPDCRITNWQSRRLRATRGGRHG